jgi:hypothetical protein
LIIFVESIKTVLVKQLQHTIDSYFEAKKALSRKQLIQSISKDFPNWKESTISVYLSKLKEEGILTSPSRGHYCLGKQETFTPYLEVGLKRIFKKIRKQFPFIRMCIWDTLWLNHFMRHQLFKNYRVIEVEKDAVNQVFHFLSERHNNVFLNPDGKIFDRYIANSDDTIIVKNLVSEAPVVDLEKIVVPTLEKLLVDMLIDEDLFAAQQSECGFIYGNAMKNYTINTLQMKRYALRRNRDGKVTELLDKTMTKV